MTPAQLGAPAKFDSWRARQDVAFDRLMLSKRRFPVLSLPTGIGKTVVGVTYALVNDLRYVYLTSTRGLQRQVHEDFYTTGLENVWGMANYPCLELPGDQPCSVGPCLDGYKCELREGGCLYFDAIKRAKESQGANSNYAFWLQLTKSGEGLGQRDLLILDEAHHAAEEVSRFMRVTLTEEEVGAQAGKRGYDINEWRIWAEKMLVKVAIRLEDEPLGSPKRRRLRELMGKLSAISDSQADWIVDQDDRSGDWTFEPLWPAPYTGNLLFRGVPKVILSSATIRPSALKYLGIGDDEYDWIEVPSPFAVGRRPIIWVPTVPLSQQSTAEDLGAWIERIDQIIERRLDRKGIIHAVSYARARWIKQHSRYGALMVTHEASDTAQVVADFKRGPAPAILLSPSVGTGYDFPYADAEYQIIAKVPFPDRSSRLAQARQEDDPTWGKYTAATELVQMAGRCMRAPDDLCETIIIDDQVNWLVRNNKQFFPRSFLDAYRKAVIIPAPPPRVPVLIP